MGNFLRTLVACSLFGVAGLHAQPAGQPADHAVPLPDYARQYHDYARSLQPDGDNGWELLTRIAELHREIAGRHYDEAFAYHDSGMVDYTLLWDPDSLDDEYTIESQVPRIHAQIEDAREAGLLELLAQLVAARNLIQPPTDGPLLDLTLPHLGWSRSIARLNCARMVLGVQVGDDDELLAAFAQNLWLSRAVPRSAPLIMGDLVGIAIEALSLRRIRDALLARQVSPRLAARILEALDAAGPTLTLPQALDADRFMRLDSITRCYTDDGHGDGLLVPDDFGTLLSGSAVGPEVAEAVGGEEGSRGFASKKQVLLREQEVHADLLAIAEAYPQDRQSLAAPFEADFKARRYHTARGQANMLLGILLPAVGKAGQVHDQHGLELAATRIMLAIEIYRGREGRPPASLADLCPGILRELPADPFTRGPLIYSREAESPLGYRLYSAGFDQTDNGGESAYEPDSRASERRALLGTGEGTDYLFVPPADPLDP